MFNKFVQYGSAFIFILCMFCLYAEASIEDEYVSDRSVYTASAKDIEYAPIAYTPTPEVPNVAVAEEPVAYDITEPEHDPETRAEMMEDYICACEYEEEAEVVEVVEEPIIEEPVEEVVEEVETEGTVEVEAKVEETKKVVLSEEDKDLLLRIGMCEAGGEGRKTITHVMRVVLNRVESDMFPNTVRKVLWEKNQFTPVSTGWIHTVVPSDECYAALEDIENGWDETQGALYFEACDGESWHSRNLPKLYSLGDVRFYGV